MAQTTSNTLNIGPFRNPYLSESGDYTSNPVMTYEVFESFEKQFDANLNFIASATFTAIAGTQTATSL